MVDRRRRWCWVAMAGLVLGLSGCTTTTLNPTTAATTAAGSASSGTPTAADAPTSGDAPTAGDTPSTSGSPTTATEASTPGPATTGATTGEDTSSNTTSPTDPTAAVSGGGTASAAAATTFTPGVDADAVDGDCPYLSKDQVQADTGQRMGTTQIRPAEPQPVCEFVRSDGKFLATVRVLQLGTDALAVSAVDFYVPRDTSNPESRPAGWSGGSLATDGGSLYAVSKGTYAVIAETNQKQSVYARLLVVHAIASLGL